MRANHGSGSPSAVFGLTAFNGERHLAEAIESLLTQTRTDLAIVVIDDCSSDRTQEIALRYAQLDSRVSYERNDRQSGLVRNWRCAFDLAGERFPEAPFFAWASDHDVWHPRWLELLTAELEAHPEAVLAYPFAVRMDDEGSEYPTRPHRFDTVGSAGPAERLRRTSRGLAAAGDVIYGLFRRDVMARCGPFPLVVLPDRLYLIRLALEGEFRQVPRRLWYRRYRTRVVMSNRRQRLSSFPEGAPWWAYVPWPLTHAIVFARSGAREQSPLVLLESLRRVVEGRWNRGRRRRRWRRRERRRRYRAAVRGTLVRLGLREPPRAVPSSAGLIAVSANTVLAGLERAELLDDRAVLGAVVLELGDGASGLEELLKERFPSLVHLAADDPAHFPERVDLAVSLDVLGRLPEEEADSRIRRLHVLGTPAVISLDRETESLRESLAAWYWPRDVWVEETGSPGRKPDPKMGPVGRTPGQYRLVVARRRLLSGAEWQS